MIRLPWQWLVAIFWAGVLSEAAANSYSGRLPSPDDLVVGIIIVFGLVVLGAIGRIEAGALPGS